MKTSILGMTLGELVDALGKLGQPRYRAAQIYGWLHERGAMTFPEMKNLGKALQDLLAQYYEIDAPDTEMVESSDGTRKFRFTLADGGKIESVWIPEESRKTLCISSQVGCPLKCAFCVTGAVGFKRNLEAHEIVAQVRHVKAVEDLPVTNIVFMGMGEPLLNTENVLKAIEILTERQGLAVGKRKITVSTAGVVPNIAPFFEASDVKLAISITGATDASRDYWMPINKKWNLAKLRKALQSLPLQKGRLITFEVVLMAGKNDTAEEAQHLAKYLRGLPAKVNVIPYNENPYFPDLKRPSDENVERFAGILKENSIAAMVRRNRGVDIQAACGQLAGDSGTGYSTPEFPGVRELSILSPIKGEKS